MERLYLKQNILDVTEVKGVPVVARCVTTNGVVKANGELVMGRGVALAFKKYYDFINLADLLGQLVKNNGNKVYGIREKNLGIAIISFPTKYHYDDNSDLDLIVKSAEQLRDLIHNNIELQQGLILLPKPGCCNGGLRWEIVKPLIDPILPINVVICSI